ncbi:Lrp/AsnC ligand binding domain-containing protein [Phytoactinopolyspora mesophila]|uniref:Lrp/AsnC ligand binding domain-containing protein n=1 Tax=Phytoactinopolyspora mesophila TaxID=2650750 RepID=UPI00157676BB
MASRGGIVIDSLDVKIIELFAAQPRIGVLEASRRIGVARATVQSRLEKLAAAGVIESFSPSINPGALGYRVTAFAFLDIRQGARSSVAAHLERIPEVLEVHTITGQGDLYCRIVARDNDDLQRVIDDLVGDADIVRISTVIALATVVAPRILPLVRAAEAPGHSRGDAI